MAPARSLFSTRQAVEFLLPGLVTRLVVAIAISIFFREDARTLLFIWFVVAVMSGVDVVVYMKAEHKHTQLSSRYGEVYEQILAAEIEKSGLPALIGRRWIDVEMALKRRLNTKELY